MFHLNYLTSATLYVIRIRHHEQFMVSVRIHSHLTVSNVLRCIFDYSHFLTEWTEFNKYITTIEWHLATKSNHSWCSSPNNTDAFQPGFIVDRVQCHHNYFTKFLPHSVYGNAFIGFRVQTKTVGDQNIQMNLKVRVLSISVIETVVRWPKNH